MSKELETVHIDDIKEPAPKRYFEGVNVIMTIGGIESDGLASIGFVELPLSSEPI